MLSELKAMKSLTIGWLRDLKRTITGGTMKKPEAIIFKMRSKDGQHIMCMSSTGNIWKVPIAEFLCCQRDVLDISNWDGFLVVKNLDIFSLTGIPKDLT